jgi:AcrR family transcriptional regulator
MSPKVPEAYLTARRTEIQQAAFNCFMEKGFHHTTMQDIYKEANLSPGAVYNYYSSKEDIVIAALKEFNEWSVNSMTSLISENTNETFNGLVEFWMSLFIHDEVSSSISVQLDFYSEASRNNNIRKAMLKSQDATHGILIEPIKQNQQAGVFNANLDPLSIARAIMGMMFGAAIHKSLDPEVDLDAYTQVFKAILNGTFSKAPEESTKAE